MAIKALLQGNAGDYRIRGAIWKLGSVAYRARVRLVPSKPRPDLSVSTVSADGTTLQEALGAAKARVTSAVGTPVERFEILAGTSDVERSSLLRRGPRRYPAPTD